jgi:hypothetical protein
LNLRPGWPWLVLALASPALAVGVVHLLGWTLHPATGLDLLWALLGSPWLEEWVYRAGVQRPVTGYFQVLRPNWSLGLVGHAANGVAALAMVAVHMPAHGGMAVAWALPALAAGELFRQTDRVWLCAALHAWFNGSLWWASS